MSKNYLVNLSIVNFTDSGHQNSIKFLQVNSLCRKILYQIDISVSRNCTQLQSSSGASGTACPLQPCPSWVMALHCFSAKLCWNKLCHKATLVRQCWDQCPQNELWFWELDLVNPGGYTKEVGLPRCPRLHLFLAMITQPWKEANKFPVASSY